MVQLQQMPFSFPERIEPMNTGHGKAVPEDVKERPESQPDQRSEPVTRNRKKKHEPKRVRPRPMCDIHMDISAERGVRRIDVGHQRPAQISKHRQYKTDRKRHTVKFRHPCDRSLDRRLQRWGCGRLCKQKISVDQRKRRNGVHHEMTSAPHRQHLLV